MAQIQLTKGYIAEVDDEDFEQINVCKWHAREKKTSSGKIKVYATRTYLQQKLYMHHEVLRWWPERNTDLEVDHLDGNSLNNRKDNLKIVTHKQNLQNMQPRKLRARGYTFHERDLRWVCNVYDRGKRIYLGSSLTEEGAQEIVRRYYEDRQDNRPSS